MDTQVYPRRAAARQQFHLHSPDADNDPRPAAETVCVVCRQIGADSLCERCKMPMHGDCQWRPGGLATPMERAAYERLAETQISDGLMVLFLCHGCRS